MPYNQLECWKTDLFQQRLYTDKFSDKPVSHTTGQRNCLLLRFCSYWPTWYTVHINPKVRQTQIQQPASTLSFLEHGYRWGAACHDTKIADHTDCRKVSHRPSRFGIQHMTITHTIDQNTTLIIPLLAKAPSYNDKVSSNVSLLRGCRMSTRQGLAISVGANHLNVTARLMTPCLIPCPKHKLAARSRHIL